MSNPVIVPSTETVAQSFLRATLAKALLGFKEPVKMSELQDACQLPLLDMDLLRYVLGANSDLFTSTERRWTLAIRFEEPTRPVHALVEQILRHLGQPVSLESLAYLLAEVYHRTPQAMAVAVYRLSGEHFFRLPDNRVGLRDWLLRLEYDSVEDTAFYNYVDLAAARRLLEEHPQYDGSPEATVALLRKVGTPLSSRFVAFLQWYLAPDSFDAVQAYANLLDKQELVSLPLQEPQALEPVTHWALAEWIPQFIEAIRPQAKQMASVLAQLMAEPLVLSVEDVEKMVQRILQSPAVVTAEELARTFFDLTPSDPTYTNDVETISLSLRQDERVMWLGGHRFVNKMNLPPYLFDVPESLHFPEVQFYTEEGDPLEIDLDDEGLSGTLRSDILDPVAQDVGDEEGELTILPVPESVQCVVKAGHKEIGTFPLCQIPAGFFQQEPSFQQVTFIDETTGECYSEVYVNQQARLLFGLLDWYATREAVSGLVFTLTRTDDPFVFKVRWEETLDQRVHISRARYEELLDMGVRMAQTYSTFDIICEILSTHRGGMEFLSILSEVNVIRRTKRRRVASVLSAFQAFYLRGGLWHLDEKKRDAGIDRAKRKHIVKR
ncbi:MAG: hypothetical protein RMM06_10765 [Armatimonadota bacterium]|nr:hypothetical protein [bacterium]MCS7310720.1 hypothetical protein [Armatimonadota bacterium]MDW8105504.1 hypothetical protein [Armatimonadota bacterium]MDW8291197.1 hypothetical protein [Armatimonadota bacterium]